MVSMDEISELSNTPSKNNLSPLRAKILKAVPSGPLSPDGSTASGKASLRAEIELKRERLKLEEESNFTFKPVFYTGNRRKDEGIRENRFDKLYSDALKRQITSQIKEEEAVKQIPFSPKFVAKPRSSSRSRSPGPSSRSSTPSKQKPDAPSFTFKPEISKRAKSIERPNTAPEIADRLYSHSHHAREKLDRKRSEKDIKDMEDCTFAPKILDPKRSQSATRGLKVVDRLSSYGEASKSRIAERQKEKEEKEGVELTFKPQIIANKRPSTPSNLPVHERLSMSTDKPLSSHVVEALSEFTFKPRLIARSVSPSSRSVDNGANIHERLFAEAVNKRMEAENVRQQKRIQLENELTFRPVINTYKPGSPTAPEEAPVFERLTADKQGVKSKIDKIKAEIMQEWTFSPALTEMTQRLAEKRDGDTTDIYTRQVASAKRTQTEAEKKKAQQEENALREATFSPKIPDASQAMVKRRCFSSSMDGMQSVNTDVYSRLSSTAGGVSPVPTFDALSLADTMTGTASIHEKRIMLNEKALDEVFHRLSTKPIHNVDHDTVPLKEEDKKKVILKEKKDLDEMFNRLNLTRTTSFAFKVNPEEAEQLQEIVAAKDAPKATSAEVAQIVERLHRSPTASLSSYDLLTLAKREGLNSTSGSNPSSPRKMRNTNSNSLRSTSFDSPTASKNSSPSLKPEKSNSFAITSPISSSKSKSNSSHNFVDTSNTSNTNNNPATPSSPHLPSASRDMMTATPSAATPTPAVPPAPPATAYKPSDHASKALNVDDFQRKIEESLRLLNDSNNSLAHPAPQPPALTATGAAVMTPAADESTPNPRPLISSSSSNSFTSTGSKKAARIVKPEAASASATASAAVASKRPPNANTNATKRPASTSRSTTPNSVRSSASSNSGSVVSQSKDRPSSATKPRSNTPTMKSSTHSSNPSNSSNPPASKIVKPTPKKGTATTAKKTPQMSPLPKDVEEFINNIPMVDNYDDESISSNQH